MKIYFGFGLRIALRGRNSSSS